LKNRRREFDEKQRRISNMGTKMALYSGVAAIALAALVVGPPARAQAQQSAAVSIGATDLGGVVSGPNGP
jgi:hypothetical protein